MPTRLVGDELDLNLPPLASGLVIVIVVVVCGGALALDATALCRGRIPVSHDMRIVVEYGWRGLVVLLIGDVGHCNSKSDSKSDKRSEV